MPSCESEGGPFGADVVLKASPLTCQMLTIFSTAAARYWPVTLQATGERLGSPGEPRLAMPSSELSLVTEKRKINGKEETTSTQNIPRGQIQ